MSEYIEVGQPLQFTDPNTPTRAGEIVENVSDIYNIPSPRLGMQVFVKSEKKSFVITSLKSKVVGGMDVPEAAVEAFEAVGAKSFTWNNDTNPSNMNDFVVAGVYDIKGERTRIDDNLPILNTGGGHTFNARLTVLDSSIPGNGKNDDKCITQVMSFNNRLGQGEVYIRTGKGASLDNLTWEKWSTLQRNVNVREVDSLDDLKDNGIYSGVWLHGHYNSCPLTFVCVVINDYFIGIAPRRVSQFVYGLSKFDGSVVYQSRVWDDSKNTWGNWEILNQKEISSMISKEISKIVNNAPETFDTLKEIADWINNDESGAAAMLLNIQQNTVKINAEVNRATEAEDQIWDEIGAINEQYYKADKEIKAQAIGYDKQTPLFKKDKVTIKNTTIDGINEHSFDIPAATETTAGVMSAEDKKKIETIKLVDSEDMIEAIVDHDNKLLESRDIEGNKTIHTSLEVKNLLKSKFLNGETISIGEAEQTYTIQDAQFILVELDSEEKIHHAVNPRGVHVFPAGIVYPQATDIYKGMTINTIGDSLSNGFTYLYGCRDILGMKIGGTMIGGTAISGSNSNAFWQNSRVNALSEDAKIIIIQGGTNDWNQVGEISVTNTDTNTLCGAFNVMISKIYYRYLNKKKAYYDNIDYSGISLVSKPVSQLPIFVILPPPCPDTDREVSVAKNAEALEKISLLWGLDIIDGRRIGFNYIHGAAADMVHAARNLFNILDAKLVSKLKSLATGMSFLAEPAKEVYSIMVLNDVHGVKTDDYAAVGDDVYISFDSLPNSVEVRDSSGNIVDCASIDTLTNIAYKFVMPNDNVTISIN